MRDRENEAKGQRKEEAKTEKRQRYRYARNRENMRQRFSVG